MTVKNDAAGAAVTLESLAPQTRQPDEIVITDGGSTDDTRRFLAQLASRDSRIRIVDAPGANIARGRNLAIAAAGAELIASIDAGCRARADWLENLTAPFETDPENEFVAGFYRIEWTTLRERVIGLWTMRGQLEPVDPKTFNPSARSVAFTKALWRRAGGFPEHLNFSEDTQFDHTVRNIGAQWVFAENAVVFWRPRSTLRALARQFYGYGTGRGQSKIDALSFHYNLRNLVLVFSFFALCAVSPWMLAPASLAVIYFYWRPFHGKAIAVARESRRLAAYPLCLAVNWTVMLSNLAGYLVGSWRAWRCGARSAARVSVHPTSN
jgi:glycosyltransferase involved in cell wall biosynthesis